MNSIEKLKRLTGEKTKAPEKPSSKQVQIDDLRRRIDTIISRRPDRYQSASEKKFDADKINLSKIVPGEETENDHGRFFLVSEVIRGSSRHGHRNIRETYTLDMTAAALLANDPSIASFNASDALFLDTETTGLAGGTGTMAFLIGLGWFEDGQFHVRQILARDFGEEKAALSYLSEIAGQKKFLVTFNGKAFDVNLLATRFILNRLRSDLSSLPHLDLLHPSRRILGHRLENSRLATLEAEVLGVEREGDIPGWEIPQRYFDWLRHRDGRLLASIFEHNRLDVISMASLTAHLTEILTAQELIQNVHASDYLAAARLLLKRRDSCGVEKILNMFNDRGCKEISAVSKKDLSFLYKRTGRWQEAVQIWQELITTLPADYSTISEMAKWLEHHVRDYQQAKDLVEKVLNQTHDLSSEQKDSLLHRLKRVNTKLEGAKR
jgi:uncharacterized protein YprB with RNaseH-like and TPR domain